MAQSLYRFSLPLQVRSSNAEDTHELCYGIRALPLKRSVARSVFFLFCLYKLFLYLLLFLSFHLVKWRKNEQQGRLRLRWNPLQTTISIFILERTQQLHCSRQFSTRRTTIHGAGLSSAERKEQGGIRFGNSPLSTDERSYIFSVDQVQQHGYVMVSAFSISSN